MATDTRTLIEKDAQIRAAYGEDDPAQLVIDKWEAAQDAPPAPRCEKCGGKGCKDYPCPAYDEAPSQPSPAHEALIARINEQRDYWEAIHDRQVTATPEYNTAIEMIAAIDDILAALKGAQ